jgi:hypothetical protein
MEAGKGGPYHLSFQGLLSGELRQFQLMLGIYYKILILYVLKTS